jgi:N-acetylglutamate synthase-like GNAT family acetyltransferase
LSISIRPATAADQAAIKHIVRSAGLFPFNLLWSNFLVAEQQDTGTAAAVLGVGQVKQHPDGSREMASIAVRPQHQGRGIGSRIVQALIAQRTTPLYLMCRDELEPFYRRFGFERIDREPTPPVLSFKQRLGNLALSVLSALRLRHGRVLVMKRP